MAAAKPVSAHLTEPGVDIVRIAYIDQVTQPDEELGPDDLGAVLRAAEPADDSGAETFDRYEWQAMLATVDLLGLYVDALAAGIDPRTVSDCGLICEYHEDWACVVRGEVELVSGKHKEPGFGAYTTANSLLGDGGLSHLFDRWHALGAVPHARLVTTAGLSGDADAIRRSCDHFREHGTTAVLANDSLQQALGRLASRLAELRSEAGKEPIDDLENVVLPNFLAGFTFRCGMPRRDHMPSMAPTAYASPIANELGRPELAVAIWEAVLSLVRGRMRAAGPARRGLLHTLEPGGPDELERRTVTVADAHVAILEAATTPGGYAPLPKLIITNKMAVKMHAGNCSATSIDRAETLRRRFSAFRRGQRSRPGGREAELDLDRALQRVADQATSATRRTTGEPWGAQLWTELEGRLEAETGVGIAEGMDTDMQLGGIADLANNCKVWFSESFDASARVRELRERQS